MSDNISEDKKSEEEVGEEKKNSSLKKAVKEDDAKVDATKEDIQVVKKKRRKIRRQVRKGRAYIKSSYNNTSVYPEQRQSLPDGRPFRARGGSGSRRATARRRRRL